jgi:hypothetical protein
MGAIMKKQNLMTSRGVTDTQRAQVRFMASAPAIIQPDPIKRDPIKRENWSDYEKTEFNDE